MITFACGIVLGAKCGLQGRKFFLMLLGLIDIFVKLFFDHEGTHSCFLSVAFQGIYYYFYQVFKNKAEAIAASRKEKGLGDGTVGMFSWLFVAAVAGYALSLCQNLLLVPL